MTHTPQEKERILSRRRIMERKLSKLNAIGKLQDEKIELLKKLVAVETELSSLKSGEAF